LKNLKVQGSLKCLLHKISSNKIEITINNNKNTAIYPNNTNFIHIDCLK